MTPAPDAADPTRARTRPDDVYAGLTARRLDGRTQDLQDYAAGPSLVVNVASRCGFTPQYAGLQALHERFGPRGLSVLGFPCNQFGHQEPGDAGEIGTFCERSYGVGFAMFDKVDVNGDAAHPLYRRLKAAAPGVLGSEAIKWNFTKFLVDAGGRVVQRYAPTTPPQDIAPDIEALLAAAGR